ncbi:unnamed product [Ostreococcus tauri]|uniref:Unnamed product n=1 Tax=Ostreococcus tauri TaxID=70448 RepID=A0A090MAE4_OSTTA|nr:unnamed product [Ostreococcus tauri]CEF99074.1 unnamed product [Ostreococcus tauri]|eukprot:XP_022839631.1 unnamed product [Ostreococcus tauri]
MSPVDDDDDAPKRRARAALKVVESASTAVERMRDGLKSASRDDFNDALDALRRSRARARWFDVVEDDVEASSTGAAIGREVTAAIERGEDYGTFWLSTSGRSARRRAEEGTCVERACGAMFESCVGLRQREYEVSATCMASGTRDRSKPRDLLEDGGDDASGTSGTTVVRLESVSDAVAAYEDAMHRAQSVFVEGGVEVDRHVVFTLRLKLWSDAETATETESEDEPVVTRVHFVFVAPYVPSAGIIGGAGKVDRAARIDCTRSLAALMAVLRSLDSHTSDSASRQIKAWRESPLTRLMWTCGMLNLHCATLYAVCENVLCHAVEDDETSPLVLPPAVEGVLKFALQLKETVEDSEPTPRTRNPPVPTPPRVHTSVKSREPTSSVADRRTRLTRADTVTWRRAPTGEARRSVTPAPADGMPESSQGEKITLEQVDAIARFIRTHASGLSGRRMEGTMRRLMTEWTQMSQSYETILEDFGTLEEQLAAAQLREDEAVEYAEQITSDLAVTSRWCESLEEEKAGVPARIKQAAMEAERVAIARADALEKRVKELEAQLVRNSVPEMERVRDEAERAAKEAIEKYEQELEKRVSIQGTLEGVIGTQRTLQEEIESVRRELETSERARKAEREETERVRNDLRQRYEVEGELRNRIAESEQSHEKSMRAARQATVEREDELNDMRRQRDDALHKVHQKEEEIVEARANARASSLNAEVAQSALSDAKEVQQKNAKEIEALKLRNSDLIVEIKHAKRELEETCIALNNVKEKLEELEDGSEEMIQKRREIDDEVHRLKLTVADLEAKNKSIEMDREVAYEAADVARMEHAKIMASVLDLTEEVSRLQSSLFAAQETTRVLLDEEAARLKQLVPPVPDNEYVSPEWLRDTSWHQNQARSLASAS